MARLCNILDVTKFLREIVRRPMMKNGTKANCRDDRMVIERVIYLPAPMRALGSKKK